MAKDETRFAVAKRCLIAVTLAGCAADGSGGTASQPVRTLFPTAGVGAAGGGMTPSSGTVGVAGLGLASMASAAGAGGVLAAGRGGLAGVGAAGSLGIAGAGSAAGSSGRQGSGGSLAAAGSGGGAGSTSPAAATGETGRMVGMTAAHNAVRAMVQTTPPIPPLTWSPTLAAYAQEWADSLAKDPSSCADPMHRSDKDLNAKDYGENLAVSGGSRPLMTTAQSAVDGWAAEVACWTYGTITEPGVGGGTEKCDTKCYMDMNSDGCGHYTQVVWRDTREVGCGVATCQSGRDTNDIWICNYYPGGNFIGEKPY